MKDMRTPLSRVRGLGSAKTGTRDFWIQWLTAAANVPLALFLITSLVALTGADYATVRSYLGNPLVAIPMLLLVLSGTLHMRDAGHSGGLRASTGSQSRLTRLEQFLYGGDRNRRRLCRVEDRHPNLANQGTS
jgi:hypothetical protein